MHPDNSDTANVSNKKHVLPSSNSPKLPGSLKNTTLNYFPAVICKPKKACGCLDTKPHSASNTQLLNGLDTIHTSKQQKWAGVSFCWSLWYTSSAHGGSV